jgi:general secretion pathway protein F
VAGIPAGKGSAVSLDQLIALNDEMAALVRAGIPLEQGLAGLGRDLRGRLGEIAGRLGERMKAGESLLEIVAGDDRTFPPAWCAVVEAGVRSGRLSAALEGLSTTARRVAEYRRAVVTALIYPLVVLCLAYCLLLFTLIWFVPGLAAAHDSLTSSSDRVLAAIAGLGRTAPWWAPWPPLIVAALLAGGWYRSGRVIYGAVERSVPGFRPSVRQVLRDGRTATFAEILAMLVKQGVPLDQAVALAGDASGDGGLRTAAKEIAARLRSGESVTGSDAAASRIPPLLAWLLLGGAPHASLAETLALVAEQYRQRAARTVTWTAVYLPIVLTAVLGGTVTFVQGLAVFGPVIRLLFQLGQPG